MNARGMEGEECMKRGRVDFQGEVKRGCKGHGGVDKGKEETGGMWGEAARGGKIKCGDRQQRR